jgi:large subunit ribosomal protein L32
MPNPKRRHSKRRTSTRRAHDHLSKPALAKCPNYKGKPATDVK